MNKIDLQGRVAAVTGGARGIGLAIAERFLSEGANVALWDMDAKRLAETAAALSGKGFDARRVAVFQLDIRDDAAVAKVAADTVAKFGKIEILVNSAGVAGAPLKTWEYGAQQFRDVVDINLNGTFFCCHAVVPHMMKNAESFGRIINIASIAGKEGNPNASAYSASKAGVIGLTKSLGKELATTGIRVNCITPAAALTEILQQVNQQHIDYMLSKIPMARFVKVEEIAAMVAWLSSEECSFTTASVIDISGGRATY